MPESLRKPPSVELPDKLIWTTEDARQADRGADWYWAVILITISLAGASILLGNYIFAVLIVVIGTTLIVQSFKDPLEVRVVVDEKGVMMENELYPYSNLDSFWVEKETGEPKLLLKSQKIFMPLVTVPINPDEVDLEELADYLVEFIDEEELSEPLTHHIMEWLGF